MAANLPPDAAPDVTDEDVERACRTIWTPKDDLELQWDSWRESHRKRMRPFVRTALEDFASRRSPRAAVPTLEAQRLAVLYDSAMLVVGEDADLYMVVGLQDECIGDIGSIVTHDDAPFLTDDERAALNGGPSPLTAPLSGPDVIARTLDWLAAPPAGDENRGEG